MDHTYLIKAAQDQDLGRILYLCQALTAEDLQYDDTWDLSWFKGGEAKSYFLSRIQDDSKLLITALINQKIVAYLAASLETIDNSRNVGSLANLESLYVESKFRSHGIGKALVGKFMGWAKDQGCQRATVTTSEANLKAISFYMREDFFKVSLTLERNLS